MVYYKHILEKPVSEHPNLHYCWFINHGWQLRCKTLKFGSGTKKYSFMKKKVDNEIDKNSRGTFVINLMN